MNTITLDLQAIALSDEQFYQLCINNSDLHIERNANGDLVIMPPTGGKTGNKNAGIIAQLWLWNSQANLGKVFDSSTGFTLPNGANRSPDASWITIAKWNNLSEQEQQKFLPLCPDFAVELVSPSDKLERTQAKMQEYLENGMILGWLINPESQQVEIYRPHQAIEILEVPDTLSGEDILPGFELELSW